MSSFVVRFFKKVIGDQGNTREACQATINVDAPCKIEAAHIAKNAFARQRGLPDWTLHADRIEVKAADYPS